MAVNDDDENNNGVPDLDEPLGHAFELKRFTPLVVDFPATADATKARVKFTYPGWDPDLQGQPPAGAIRIWTKGIRDASLFWA